MPGSIRWLLALTLAALVTVVPLVHFRWVYTHRKRLREVVPGKVYRSGEPTARGFEDIVRQFGIRTVINLEDEFEDPDLFQDYFTLSQLKESELCRQLGVNYVYLPPDLLPRNLTPPQRPKAIDRFLEICDNPANYPILVHCHAGLHRTGVMIAVYRMEYHGWTPHQAIQEMKANGFAEWPCTSANEYIAQYILSYRPGVRNAAAVARGK
jgi:protein tyrosine/serine phosphatase